MKKITSMAAFAMLSFASFAQALDPVEFLPNLEAKSGCNSYIRCKKPLGSYYADSTSRNPLQQVVVTDSGLFPQTALVDFPGTNVEAGVFRSLTSNSIIVPKRGYYKIEWNATLSFVPFMQGLFLNYHFDLQKNGSTLLHPIPQVRGILLRSNPDVNSVAGSVIVPLCPQDEISLVAVLDGSEGPFTGDGFQIDSAQISAHWISDYCH